MRKRTAAWSMTSRWCCRDEPDADLGDVGDIPCRDGERTPIDDACGDMDSTRKLTQRRWTRSDFEDHIGRGPLGVNGAGEGERSGVVLPVRVDLDARPRRERRRRRRIRLSTATDQHHAGPDDENDQPRERPVCVHRQLRIRDRAVRFRTPSQNAARRRAGRLPAEVGVQHPRAGGDLAGPDHADQAGHRLALVHRVGEHPLDSGAGADGVDRLRVGDAVDPGV